MACSEDDQLCTVSEIPFESFLEGTESASRTADAAASAGVVGSCARVSGPDAAVLGDVGVSPGAVDSSYATADESKGIVELREVNESELSKCVCRLPVRQRLQVRVNETLDCLRSLSQIFHLFRIHLILLIHVLGLVDLGAKG